MLHSPSLSTPSQSHFLRLLFYTTRVETAKHCAKPVSIEIPGAQISVPKHETASCLFSTASRGLGKVVTAGFNGFHSMYITRIKRVFNFKPSTAAYEQSKSALVLDFYFLKGGASLSFMTCANMKVVISSNRECWPNYVHLQL